MLDKDQLPATDPTAPALPPALTIEERLAELEGKAASSWALKAVPEYEAGLREQFKGEILNFNLKLAAGVLLALVGVGYVGIKTAILAVYEQKDQQTFAGLQSQFDQSLKELQAGTEWNKLHDYAKNYIYLADFDWNAYPDENDRHKRIKHDLDRAEHYFNLALRTDRQQATSYWELAELRYTYAMEYNAGTLDRDAALSNYQRAIDSYSEPEIGKGWRAEALLKVGTIYSEKAEVAHDVKEKQNFKRLARNSLERAIHDYSHTVYESGEDTSKHSDQAKKLLLEIGSAD
jgi:hypothetical protein